MSEEEEIIETVEKAKKPGTFNILNVLKDRGLPSEEVEVYLDEGIAYHASQIDDSIKQLEKRLDKMPDLADGIKDLVEERDELIAERDKIVEQMGGALFVFHLQGISEGKREDLYEVALKEYPMQYETDRSPFTGQSEKKELSSSERDRYFTNLLWQAHIVKIVSPDGDVQDTVTYDEAVELRRSMPLTATSKINNAIEKLRTSTALFMMSVDEGFLAKS